MNILVAKTVPDHWGAALTQCALGSGSGTSKGDVPRLLMVMSF